MRVGVSIEELINKVVNEEDPGVIMQVACEVYGLRGDVAGEHSCSLDEPPEGERMGRPKSVPSTCAKELEKRISLSCLEDNIKILRLTKQVIERHIAENGDQW